MPGRRGDVTARWTLTLHKTGQGWCQLHYLFLNRINLSSVFSPLQSVRACLIVEECVLVGIPKGLFPNGLPRDLLLHVLCAQRPPRSLAKCRCIQLVAVYCKLSMKHLMLLQVQPLVSVLDIQCLFIHFFYCKIWTVDILGQQALDKATNSWHIKCS